MSAILSISGKREIPILGACTIGRAESNMVVLDHPRVSRRHAVILELAADDYWLFEFKNRNGTVVNGAKVDGPLALRNDDDIILGGEVLRFRRLESKRGGRSRNASSIQQTTEGAAPAEIPVEPNLYEPAGHGVIALDDQFAISAITEPAREWLEKYYPESIRNSHLPAALADWAAARCLAIRGRSASADTPPPVFIKERHEERLAVKLQLELGGEACMLLVSEEKPLFTQDTLKEDFGRDFDVTPRQAEVLYWVALGKSNPLIAKILDIALGTVIKHLENSYPKIEVGNRHETLRFIEDYYRRNRDI